jgi:hypothetical protein
MYVDHIHSTVTVDKLVFYLIEEKFKTLIESYLTDGYQKVVIGNRFGCSSFSEWEVIKCSVPQESILDPLFFCAVH